MTFLLQVPLVTKRVVVQMSDTCHKALKQYAAFHDMTMSEVLYNCTKMQFHKQAMCCEFVDDMFDKLDIDLDKRAVKPCFSFMCFGCKYATACKTGLYEGVVEIADQFHNSDLITPWGKIQIARLQIEAGQEPQFNCTDGSSQIEQHAPRMRRTRKYVTIKSPVGHR